VITAETIRQALQCGEPGCDCHKPTRHVHCPAHADSKPSLSVTEKDGKILVKDFGRCSQDRVIAALKEKGLWPSSNGDRPQARRKARGKPEAIYDYQDADGKIIFQVCRYHTPTGKSFLQRRPDDKGGWIWGLSAGEYGRWSNQKDWYKVDKKKSYVETKNFPECKPVLYRLPEVQKADTVYIPEGEKDVDRLRTLGLTATTNPGGANVKWQKSYNKHFKGKAVIILPDNDKPGKDHALDVARNLHVVAASVKVVELPGLPEKGDVSDWMEAGGTVEQLLALADATPAWDQDQTQDEEITAPEDDRKRPTQAELLIKLAGDAELFHDINLKGYATIPVDSHRETWPIRAKGFRSWLSRRFYEKTSKAPGGQAWQDALGVLEAQAHFDGPGYDVYVRVAHVAGKIYIDLANDSWQAVEITRSGWRVVDDPPVKFRRPRGLAAMPTPQPGGNLNDLKRFINCREEDWPLVGAWLVGAFSPGPYPVIALQGEQGTAKSTAARALKSLVDPGSTLLRTSPRNIQDLMIAASNSWCLSFDNLSDLKPWLSDGFCRLSTGGGMAARELYSDDEETILDAMRPVILNGIDSLVSRGDLAARTILLELLRIEAWRRRREGDLWREFDAARPGILGAVFNALSAALANFQKVELAQLPRMADFATWVVAAELALPWKQGDFLAAYTRNCAAVVEHSLDADPVAMAVRAFMEGKESWEGTPSELLVLLEGWISEGARRSKSWPKAANSLSNRLRRAAPALRAGGIEIERTKSGSKNRTITIFRIEGGKDRPDRSDRPFHCNSEDLNGDDKGDDPTVPKNDPQKRPSPRKGTDGKGWDDGDDKKPPISKPDESGLPLDDAEEIEI
jgi:hypothetical protein